jgi:hypothetical protein
MVASPAERERRSDAVRPFGRRGRCWCAARSGGSVQDRVSGVRAESGNRRSIGKRRPYSVCPYLLAGRSFPKSTRRFGPYLAQAIVLRATLNINMRCQRTVILSVPTWRFHDDGSVPAGPGRRRWAGWRRHGGRGCGRRVVRGRCPVAADRAVLPRPSFEMTISWAAPARVDCRRRGSKTESSQSLITLASCRRPRMRRTWAHQRACAVVAHLVAGCLTCHLAPRTFRRGFKCVRGWRL